MSQSQDVYIRLLDTVSEIIGGLPSDDEHGFWYAIERAAARIQDHAVEQRIAIEAVPWWQWHGEVLHCRVCGADYVADAHFAAPPTPDACATCSARSSRCPTCLRWGHHLPTCSLRVRD